MKKAGMLKILNPVLLLLATVQVITVIVLKTAGSEFIGELHEITGYVIGAGVVLHLYLNWTWIRTNFFAAKIKTGKSSRVGSQTGSPVS